MPEIEQLFKRNTPVCRAEINMEVRVLRRSPTHGGCGPHENRGNCRKTCYVRVRALADTQGQPFAVHRPNCSSDFGTRECVGKELSRVNIKIHSVPIS